MKRRHIALASVGDPTGRLDVLLYQIVSRVVDQVERDHGLAGIREHILPIVEEAIVAHVPGRNLIPQEIAAVLKVCEMNRGRIHE